MAARHWGKYGYKSPKQEAQEYDEYEDEEEESISVYDAAEIWRSNGEDEDYTFGYTEDELENALR